MKKRGSMENLKEKIMSEKDENLVKAIQKIYEDGGKKLNELIEIFDEPITDILRKAGYLAEDEEVDGNVKFNPDEGYSKLPDRKIITDGGEIGKTGRGVKTISLEGILMVFGYKKK